MTGFHGLTASEQSDAIRRAREASESVAAAARSLSDATPGGDVLTDLAWYLARWADIHEGQLIAEFELAQER